MPEKKILMIVGDFIEDYEAMVPFQMLTMVGHKVDTVCPDKKAGESVKTAIHDFEGDQTYSEKRGHNFGINKSFEDVKMEEYDALIIPGGRAPEYIRLNEDVIKIVKHFDETNKPIAAICHGPQVLAAADVLKGKKTMCYPAVKPDVIIAGAEYIDVNETFSNAIVSDNLVSAAAWPAHPEWMKKFLDLLGTKIEP
ncbi:MAG: DJ-1/PfpI family protein [Candidatus Hodarchaeales archaeon]|jgi:protease I